jgi:hypothetical protein
MVAALTPVVGVSYIDATPAASCINIPASLVCACAWTGRNDTDAGREDEDVQSEKRSEEAGGGECKKGRSRAASVPMMGMCMVEMIDAAPKRLYWEVSQVSVRMDKYVDGRSKQDTNSHRQITALIWPQPVTKLYVNACVMATAFDLRSSL